MDVAEAIQKAAVHNSKPHNNLRPLPVPRPQGAPFRSVGSVSRRTRQNFYVSLKVFFTVSESPLMDVHSRST
jgi:hypothetical protein